MVLSEHVYKMQDHSAQVRSVSLLQLDFGRDLLSGHLDLKSPHAA